jgi:hypothetical protein
MPSPLSNLDRPIVHVRHIGDGRRVHRQSALGKDTAGFQELQDNYAAMIAFPSAGFESTDPPRHRRTRHVLS